MSFVDELTDGLESIGSTLADWIPRILVALLVLVVGRWILRMIRKWVERLLEIPAVQSVFKSAGISAAMEPSGKSPAKLVATLVYAFLMIALWLIVARILQIEPIVELLERLIAVLPLIFVAVALVIIAAAVASFVSDLIRPFADSKGVGWLPSAVKVVIILFGVLAALDLLDITFAEDLVKIVTAAVGVALAIAFGVGGIDAAKQWWAKYGTPKPMS